MTILPQFQTKLLELSLMQNRWAEIIQPVVDKPFNSGLILESITVASGDNIINHKLGKKLQGWIVKRMRNGFIQLYDKQDSNIMPDRTLVLNSSGSGLIDLIVF